MQPRPEGAAYAGVGAEPLPLCWLQHPSSEYCQADGRAIILQWMTTRLPPLQYSIDELQLDTHCLFDLVLMDSEFEGLLSNLSQSAVEQTVVKVMRVLFTPDTFLVRGLSLGTRQKLWRLVLGIYMYVQGMFHPLKWTLWLSHFVTLKASTFAECILLCIWGT